MAEFFLFIYYLKLREFLKDKNSVSLMFAENVLG